MICVGLFGEKRSDTSDSGISPSEVQSASHKDPVLAWEAFTFSLCNTAGNTNHMHGHGTKWTSTERSDQSGHKAPSAG